MYVAFNIKNFGRDVSDVWFASFADEFGYVDVKIFCDLNQASERDVCFATFDFCVCVERIEVGRILTS
mgnify:CR=1 FL=1